jgi:K+-transporting ATPase ATPase C chain
MKDIKRALKLTVVFTVILGIIYPAAMTGISKVLFNKSANGSLVYMNGTLIGSELIGQKFTEDKWFQGRPSAVDYDASKSGGTNIAMSNPKFASFVEDNISSFLKANPTVKRQDIPADIITASASGLDPEISVASARLQAERIAKANNMTVEKVNSIIEENKESKFLGIFGQERINVLKLNLALVNR